MSAPAPVICAVYDSGHVCTKALNHVGEHATITVSGVTRHRWTQTTPGDAVTDRAPASSGATNAIVELDRADRHEHLVRTIQGVLYTTPYDQLGWRPVEGRFTTDADASEHLARQIAEWVVDQ
jgi:hypothetical protein